MYFILILILIAALAYLVYKQAKSEQQWQAELQEHHKSHPRYKIIDGYKAEPEANEPAEPQAQQLELPVETEQEPEAPTTILPNDGLAFTLIDDAPEQPTEAPAAPLLPENVITLEEATRNMLRAARHPSRRAA